MNMIAHSVTKKDNSFFRKFTSSLCTRGMSIKGP